jgi:hypothetical protein
MDPHIYGAGRLIVLYTGNRGSFIRDELDHLFGKQFAASDESLRGPRLTRARRLGYVAREETRRRRTTSRGIDATSPTRPMPINHGFTQSWDSSHDAMKTFPPGSARCD